MPASVRIGQVPSCCDRFRSPLSILVLITVIVYTVTVLLLIAMLLLDMAYGDIYTTKTSFVGALSVFPFS